LGVSGTSANAGSIVTLAEVNANQLLSWRRLYQRGRLGWRRARATTRRTAAGNDFRFT
jgi:transposase-like protein